MRAGSRIATAVRRKNGEIVTRVEDHPPLAKRNWFFRLPVVRGALNLIDMLSVGIGTLNWSADIAMQDEAEVNGGKPRKKSTALVSMLLAFIVAIALFVLFPMLVAKFSGMEKHALGFNLVAGAIRIIIFFGYLVVISFIPDIKRVFQYHGAEHKSIFAFERGEELTIENAQRYGTLHPRCGTSFLLIVAVLSIIFFAVIDSVVSLVLGFVPMVFVRFLYHLVLWFPLAGICYEFLKLSAKLSERFTWARILIYPGLLMQRISTGEPTDDMVEVALIALKSAIQDNESITLEKGMGGSQCCSKN